MDSWEDFTEGKTFITDLGADKTADIEGEAVSVGRYAVWSPVKNGKGHMIVEVGGNLDNLSTKYSVPRDMIFIAVG